MSCKRETRKVAASSVSTRKETELTHAASLPSTPEKETENDRLRASICTHRSSRYPCFKLAERPATTPVKLSSRAPGERATRNPPLSHRNSATTLTSGWHVSSNCDWSISTLKLRCMPLINGDDVW